MGIKPILCLDFDGVLHAYTSGWQGVDVIPDPPVPGAFEFLRAADQHFTVAVYSSRSHQPGGQAAMQAWLRQWAEREAAPGADLHYLDRIQWPLEKPGAFVTLDDRALTFNGKWPAIETLRSFRPWYKRASKKASKS